MSFKTNHLYKVNKVKYQSWFTKNRLKEGSLYLLTGQYCDKEPEGTKFCGVFKEVLPCGKLGNVCVADTDWWFTQVSYTDCVDMGEYDPVTNNGTAEDSWLNVIGKSLPKEALEYFEIEYNLLPVDFLRMVKDLSGNGNNTEAIDLMTECLGVIEQYEINEFVGE